MSCLLVLETDSLILQVLYKLTFSQIEERQQKLADYLAITGVVDEFDSGEINGLPLFGTDGYLTRFSDKIQTVPTDIIKNIDANESNPADNELIKSRAEKLGYLLKNSTTLTKEF